MFALAVGVLVALAVAAGVLTGPATVTVPGLHGGKRRVDSALETLHLHARFAGAFSDHVEKGSVVSQSPGARARVKEGSTVDVVLSRGPRPIRVPPLVGKEAGAAAAQLHRIGLNDRVIYVPDAPGTAPGIVTGQSTRPGGHLFPRSTVTLQVAETPSWKYVTSFSGTDGGQSAPFHIRGSQWRMLYTMSYQGTCDFVFWCSGPSAQVIGAGSTNTSFDLSDGGTQTRVFKTGAGEYQVTIKPGLDSARWSVRIEDWF